MFKGKDGNLSTTKIISFIGFFAFLAVSVYCLYAAPAKFDYVLFSIISGGGSVSARVLDKYLNIKGGKNE